MLSVSTGDPPMAAVAITVTMLGAAAGDVPVYFQNADSTVVLATKTDARGLAWATLADGGYVSAIEPHEANGITPITTFAAVKAGDRLRLALQQPIVAPQVVVTLSLPDPGDPAAIGFDIHNPCSDVLALNGTVGKVTFNDCAGGAIDLVIVPRDSDGNHRFGALFASGVPIIDGDSASVAGMYTSFSDLPFTDSNIPSQVSYLGTYRAVVTPRGRVYDVSIGDQVTSTTVTDSVVIPPVPADTLVLTATDEIPISSELGEQVLFDWRTIGTPYDVDLAAHRLPPFTSTPTYNLAARSISWSERSGGVSANFVRVTLHGDRADIPADHAWSWRIAAPKSGTSVTLPKLPVEGFDFNPADGDVVAIDGLTTAALSGGYDAVRAHAFDDLLANARVAPGIEALQLQSSPQF